MASGYRSWRTLLLTRSILSLSIAAISQFASPAHATSKGDKVGEVTAFAPKFIAELDGNVRELDLESGVLFGNLLKTSSTGVASVLFADNTNLYLSQNSEFLVDEYIFESSKKSFVITLLRGALRYASGGISGANFQARTALIGVGPRGTVFSMSAEPERSVVYVEKGSVSVQTSRRAIVVAAGEALVIDRDGTSTTMIGWPPALHAQVTSIMSKVTVEYGAINAVPAEVLESLNNAAASAREYSEIISGPRSSLEHSRH